MNHHSHRLAIQFLRISPVRRYTAACSLQGERQLLSTGKRNPLLHVWHALPGSGRKLTRNVYWPIRNSRGDNQRRISVEAERKTVGNALKHEANAKVANVSFAEEFQDSAIDSSVQLSNDLVPGLQMSADRSEASPGFDGNVVIVSQQNGTQDIASSKTVEARKERPKGYFPKKGEEWELECESLAFKGMGVCKIVETGFVVLCERALPGERLIAKISKVTRRKGSFAQAYKVKTLRPHTNKVEPPCEHFGTCGGCKLQNLAYSGQLAVKQKQVEDLVARVGRFGPSSEASPAGTYMKPILPCAQEYRYRNKMEFSFGSRIWLPAQQMAENKDMQALETALEGCRTLLSEGASNAIVDSGLGLGVDPEAPPAPLLPAAALGPKSRNRKRVEPNPHQFALGLHAPQRFDKVLPINSCLLQHEEADLVLKRVREFCEMRTNTLPPYDPITHEGFMRHLTIRTGRNPTDGGLQIMVNLTTKADRPDLLQPLVAELVEFHPSVVSILNTVNPGLGDGAVGMERLLHGQATIADSLRGLTFEISAASFFQTNTVQAEELYRLVQEACDLKGDRSEVMLDLFCGTGTIGLSMASKVHHVYGYELVPEAVADARRNAARNGITNATFVEGDLNKVESAFGADMPRPDIIITDPNRPGMHPKLLKFIAGSGCPRVVYVSCNPATCARDLDVLCHGEDGKGGAFKLLSVQPVDMFPHTPHVECVSVLERVTGPDNAGGEFSSEAELDALNLEFDTSCSI